MEQTARRQEQLPGAFNGATTNSQHGRLRWYLVHTPHGKERETREKVRRIIPNNLMQDAFVMQKEFWFKRDGAWSLQTKPNQTYVQGIFLRRYARCRRARYGFGPVELWLSHRRQ